MRHEQLGVVVALVALVAAGGCGGTSTTLDTTPEAAAEVVGGGGVDSSGDAGGESVGGGTGHAGAGGQAGNKAAAGHAGEGTLSEVGGAGGRGNEPFVKDCRGKAIELDAGWVRFCVLAASCTTGEFFGIPGCIASPKSPAAYHFGAINGHPPFTHPGPSRPSYWSCAETVTSCDDVIACSGVEPPLPTETCDAPGTADCKGNSRTYCNPDGLLFEAPDCGLIGNFECTPSGGTNADDAWLACVPPGCSGGLQGEPQEGCVGDDYEASDGYWSIRLHCPDYGFATCRDALCAD